MSNGTQSVIYRAGDSEPVGDLHTKCPMLSHRVSMTVKTSSVLWGVRCLGSGGRGQMLERDGWDERSLRCPECGKCWFGGAVEPLVTQSRREA